MSFRTAGQSLREYLEGLAERIRRLESETNTTAGAVPNPADVAPPNVAAASALGTSLDYARENHTHGSGGFAGPPGPAGAPGAAGAAGATGATGPAGPANFDAVALEQIDIGDASSVGVSATVPHRDHQHPFPAPAAGYPQDVAAAEADGAATTTARADHVHAHGSGYLPNAHHSQAHTVADHTTAVNVEDEGAAQGAVVTFDFVGAGVTAVVVGTEATVTIPGGAMTFDNPIASRFGDTMGAGVDTDAARADHKHDRRADMVNFLMLVGP